MLDKTKVLLYFPTNIDININTSVYKKFLAQIKGFKENGFDVDYIFHNNNGIQMNEKHLPYPNSVIRLLVKYFGPILGYFLFFFRSKVNFKDYKKVVIRFKTATPLFLILARYIKRKNGNAKIILEIPTYPYTMEFTGLLYKYYFRIEQLFCKTLKRYVDITYNFTNQTSIYGIKSIPIFNGYNDDLLNLKIDLSKREISKNHFYMVAMASSIDPVHGFDRILRSLSYTLAKKENNDLELKLIIIGKGREYSNLQDLAEELNLMNWVNFAGYLDDKAIQEVLLDCDVCFSSMAIYRKGLQYESPLKSVYYCFSGIPFVICGTDLRFPENFRYVYRVPNDDSLIDINNIIRYINDIKTEHPFYRNEMNTYAREFLSWKTQIHKLLSAMEVN